MVCRRAADIDPVGKSLCCLNLPINSVYLSFECESARSYGESGTMTDAKPAIIETAWQGWRYAFAAFSRMPLVLGAGMLLTLVVTLVTFPLMPVGARESGLTETLIGLVIGVVQGFLLTPVAIATHRFVLLGELAPRYAPDPKDARFMRFFVFSVVYQLLVVVPATLMQFTDKTSGWLAGLLGFAGFVLFIAAMIISLRVLILFPAIAVDARGADWRNALLDSKGHTWRIFFIVLLTALPMLVVAIPLYYTFAWPPGPGVAAATVLSVFQAVIGVLALAAFAAVASRLFAAFSRRLNG